MISRELNELCNDIIRQLDIAMDTSRNCDLVSSFKERGYRTGVSINNFSAKKYDYKDFRVNLYIDRDYFYRHILKDARGATYDLAYEILTHKTVMGWPIYLVVDNKDHPPYKIFITMKGEDYVEK